MEEIDRLRWFVLASLTDDEEALYQVWRSVAGAIPGTSRAEVADNLSDLVAKGFVSLPGGVAFDRAKLLAETEENYDTTYCFRLTESGSAVWESNAERFSGAPVSWENASRVSFDHKAGTGYVQGTTKEVCLKALADGAGWEQGLKAMADRFKYMQGLRLRLDKSSFRHSTIDGFHAAYHKYLTGGHRIDFRFSQDADRQP